LRPFYRAEQSFPFPARPYVENERRIVYRHEIFVEQPVHDAVADGSDGDAPLLIVRDVKNLVPAVPVRTSVQFFGEAKQIVFQMIGEILQLGGTSFSPPEFPPRIPEI